MSNITGSFYFKRTKFGNLIGELINYASDNVITETANLISDIGDDYSGDYQATWIDISNHLAELKITKISNKYKLEWSEPNNLSYLGEGFLVDDTLIGSYYQK